MALVIQCPRCQKHLEPDPKTGSLPTHSGQFRRGKLYEETCAASGVVAAYPRPGGEFAARERFEVLNDIDRNLGLPGKRKPKNSGGEADVSIRAVRGGLPGLGRRS